MCSGLIHSWTLLGDVQLHTKRSHELVKTVFRFVAAHVDFGWQWIESL